jgi:ABC-type lipoprotein release transport system permease subunit
MNPPVFGRLLNILDYALSSLRRNLGKNGTIFILFSLVIFLFSSFQLMTGGLTGMAQRVLATAPDITVQQMSAGRQVAIAATAGEQLAGIFGVRKVTERIWGYYFDESNGANYTIIGISPKVGEEVDGGWPGLAEGRLPRPGDRGKAVVSSDIRDSLGLGDRRQFTLFRPDLSQVSFETIGTFAASLDILTADLMLMTIEDARDLFAIGPDVVTDFLVDAGNPLEIETIAKKIGELLPGVRVITRDRILKTYQVVFSWRSGLGGICLLTALIAFVIFAWDRASGLSREEVREVGILKVLGWQASDIILLRFCESAIVSLLSFLSGYLLAWLHVAVFDGTFLRPILLGWSVLRPAVSLTPQFVATDMLLIFSISVIPYLCATAVPAWRSAVVRAESVI